MKKKMKLNDLRVESFVTDLGQNQAQTAKGGVTPTVIVSLIFCPAITATIAATLAGKCSGGE